MHGNLEIISQAMRREKEIKFKYIKKRTEYYLFQRLKNFAY